MAINMTTLFTTLGKFVDVFQQTETFLGTTFDTEVQDAVDSVSGTFEIKGTVQSARGAIRADRGNFTSLINTGVKTPAQNYIIRTVFEDNPREANNITTSLAEVNRQMIVGGESLQESSVGGSVGYGGSNVGDGVLVLSVKTSVGTASQRIFAETITGVMGATSLTLLGEAAESDLLSTNWPKGSGSRVTLTPLTTVGLITNGDFQDAEPNSSNQPLGWDVPEGEASTDLTITDTEVQEIVISGSPTSGWYAIKFTDSSDEQLTEPLAYNASEADVQAALRKLKGLEDVTVSTSGTTPNFTHEVTLEGVPNPDTLAVNNHTDSGSFVINVTTAGHAAALYGGKVFGMVGDGATNTTIDLPLTLLPNTLYAIDFTLLASAAPAAGDLEVSLVDGEQIPSSYVANDNGDDNKFTIDLTTLTTSYSHHTGVFITPDSLPDILYLRLRQSTALESGRTVYFGRVAMQAMTQLYTGGPYAALFDGATSWDVDDTIDLTMTNDRAGDLETVLYRLFKLDSLGIQFPVSGSPTQSDALIA